MVYDELCEFQRNSMQLLQVKSCYINQWIGLSRTPPSRSFCEVPCGGMSTVLLHIYKQCKACVSFSLCTHLLHYPKHSYINLNRSFHPNTNSIRDQTRVAWPSILVAKTGSGNRSVSSEAQLLQGILPRHQLCNHDARDGHHGEAPVVQLPVTHVLGQATKNKRSGCKRQKMKKNDNTV